MSYSTVATGLVNLPSKIFCSITFNNTSLPLSPKIIGQEVKRGVVSADMLHF